MIEIEDLKDVKDFEQIESNLEIKYYVSMDKKRRMIDSIVDAIVKKDETGMYTYNSIILEVYKKASMISLYTNIKLLNDNFENYDILVRNGLLGYVETKIYENSLYGDIPDFELYYDLLEERVKDKIRNNSINHIMSRRTKELVETVDHTMEHLNKMLDKGDPNKIAKYLSKSFDYLINKLPDMSKFDIDQLVNKGK